ncbi:MAG: ABC transporter substrate-binding protein, partial [Candidatus Dadabacteria bacterium]|nr:ABC transporter substrate-binding protein [Candidatus Dadabacteria bacterium]
MRIILGIALALILFGSHLGRADDTIKIGVILSMTGGTSAFGHQTWTGMQVGKDIKPKVFGKDVELILVDNKSDKIESANAAQRLIQKDEVIGIIGDVASSNSLAIAPIVEKSRIPHISPSSTNPMVTLNRKYVFRACFIDPLQGEVMAKFAYNDLKARKAAVLTDIGQDYSVGLTSAFVKTYKKLGGQIVSRVNYNSGDQDFTAQLTAIKGTNPDIIAITGYYTEIALIAKQARELGINANMIAGDGAEAPELTEIGGDAVDGLYYTTHFDEKAVLTPLGKQYVDIFRKKNKSTPDALGALGADAYLMMLDAIERAGSTNPEKIRDEIEKTKDFKGITGNITINNNHDAIKSV